MYKPKTTQERILHRMKIARGHFNTVIAMMENSAYCIDIIHQSQAIQQAMKDIDSIILENHLQTCVSDAIRDGKKDEAISEVLEVFKRSGK